MILSVNSNHYTCMLNINGPPPVMCIVKRQSPMEIEHIEKSLGMKLPERHKKAMFDAGDRIHSVCDFLLSHNTDKIPDLVEENKRFFFSSRRRHTILVSDWSSDVCSSD